jgi:outer membrane protein assembly factor BamB
VYQPDAKAFTEIASIKVAEMQTYAHPVLAGNRLFVRDQDSVTLWTIQ